MRHLVRAALALTATIVAAVPAAGEPQEPPLAGCYERGYDAAHLSAHKKQFVVRVTLLVAPTTWGGQPGEAHPIIADGTLKIWVRGKTKSFDSHGVCRAEGGGLVCDGSVSAAEAETCKTARD